MATSIDAFAVGLSFAMLDMKIWYPSLVIGIVAAGMTLAGMLLGGRISKLFGKRIEIVGGLVLLGIGVKILLENILP